MLPNSEESGEPKPSNLLLNKHVEYSDQQLGAVHSSLCNKDFKRVCYKKSFMFISKKEKLN